MAFDRREFSVSEARMALVDLLSAFQGPTYLPRLEAARAEAGNDMLKQVRVEKSYKFVVKKMKRFLHFSQNSLLSIQ